MTNWRDHIGSDPEILTGKPVVKGTRLAIDFILGLFAAGWTEQQVLESYPTLTPQALRAVFAFAVERIREEFPHVLSVLSPRLVQPEQATDFTLTVIRETPSANI